MPTLTMISKPETGLRMSIRVFSGGVKDVENLDERRYMAMLGGMFEYAALASPTWETGFCH